jgi:hypothetical protein
MRPVTWHLGSVSVGHMSQAHEGERSRPLNAPRWEQRTATLHADLSCICLPTAAAAASAAAAAEWLLSGLKRLQPSEPGVALYAGGGRASPPPPWLQPQIAVTLRFRFSGF